MRNVAIVGAGAMGCLFAAKLVQAGIEATLIDIDPARLEKLNHDGLVLTEEGIDDAVMVRACTANQVNPPIDLVLIFTKGMHTKAAAASIAHLAGPSTYVATLQNGIGNTEAIAAVFPQDHILIGATDYPADLVEPARVVTHGQGTIWLGAFAGGPWEIVTDTVRMFGQASFNAVPCEDVLVKVWEKLAFNAALNALATVTEKTVGELDTLSGRRIAFAIVDEVTAVASGMGIALDRAAIARKMEHALAFHRDHKASMLQDRLAGRPTEIEAINGAIARAAAEKGIAAPVNSVLADLIRVIEGGQ